MIALTVKWLQFIGTGLSVLENKKYEYNSTEILILQFLAVHCLNSAKISLIGAFDARQDLETLLNVWSKSSGLGLGQVHE